MVRTFVNSFKVSFTQNANISIYFLKRIPLVGKQTHSIVIMGIISEVWELLCTFFKKFLYLGFMIILPSLFIAGTSSPILPEFLHIFFFLSFILGSLMESTVFDINNMSAFYMINLMKVDPRKYYLGQIIYIRLTQFIYFLFPMLVMGLMLGFSPLKAVVLIIELIAFRFMSGWLHLYTYEKTGMILAEKSIFIFSALLGGLAASYVLPVLGITINFQFILFNIYIIIPLLILGAVSFIYLWKYNKYPQISKFMLTRDKLFGMENFEADLNFESVKLDETKMNKKDLITKIYDKKQGYEYLNSLFFLRHRRILVSPIKAIVTTIGVIFLICICIILFFPSTRLLIPDIIGRSTPFLVFIMYLMSTGDTICKAMFYNCDISLLRYHYYREGNIILTNFTTRLKMTILLNIVPAIALCLAIAGVIVANGSSSRLISLIPLFLCIICLSCFFSIHHLFMYYVLQPYTAELTVESPSFTIITVVMYLVCYGCLQIHTSSYFFTLGVLIVTILYMPVALILTYKLAPRTFKLR
ncbi:MAG TPA: hypothetical protein VIM70_20295 [Clostridium sp.]|uniref:hypothetical protein n=1 Tax=Clostridium sp. TaxID=1506 RepID=UPI002F95A352